MGLRLLFTQDFQGHFGSFAGFDPKGMSIPFLPCEKPDDVDHFVCDLGDVSSGGSFRPGRMRVVDAEQVQPMGFDPVKSTQLLSGVHAKAYRTLFCVAHAEHSLDGIMRPGQQYRLTISFAPDVQMIDA